MKRASLLLLVLLLVGCMAQNPVVNPVLGPNQPPSVFYYIHHVPSRHDLYEYGFMFEGSDEDGMIVRVVWEIDGETFELEHYLAGGLWAWPELNYTFPQVGCYSVKVTVWDNDGARAVSRVEPCFEVRTPGTW